MINATLLTVYVLVIATIDLRAHRIPNTVTLAALIASLSVAVVSSGGSGALGWAGGLIVGFIIFLPFYLLRAFGGGDVKAMAAVGSFLGAKGALIACMATLIAGGIIGTCVLFATAVTLRHGLYRLIGTFSAPLLPAQSPGKSVQRFPYGIAIAVGAIFAAIAVIPDLEPIASAAQ
jgi:prepilin peptidase CpaA